MHRTVDSDNTDTSRIVFCSSLEHPTALTRVRGHQIHTCVSEIMSFKLMSFVLMSFVLISFQLSSF